MKNAHSVTEPGVTKTLHCVFSIGVLRTIKLEAHITLSGELVNRSTIVLHHL